MRLPAIPLRVVLAAVPYLVKRVRWRAKHPGPADITPGRPPSPVLPAPQFDSMTVSFKSMLALVAGLAALLVSPDIAPMLPPEWTKAVAAVATALAAFAPKAVEFNKE